ncbi:MAG: class IV adenylate cyclase [Wenzhouxiangella sp.]|jgi:adenylate cyclase class IV|nr:class IV adenylate cyclase [Wenzhouxiangella sp.]
MARNVEIKAKVRDFQRLEALAKQLADRGPERIAQDDTFFHCPNGRLKLRDFGNGTAELIFYRRADESGPKTSFYRITSSHDPEGLRDTLTLAYGQLGRVVKQRTLYLAGRTRIHLDQVEGLGDFMELEVVLSEGEDEAAGLHEAENLMQALGIQDSDLVKGAYLDLILAAGGAE